MYGIKNNPVNLVVAWNVTEEGAILRLLISRRFPMKIKEFDTVILKNGQSASIVEKLSEDTFIADIGDSPKDWDTITITINDIEKVAPREI